MEDNVTEKISTSPKNIIIDDFAKFSRDEKNYVAVDQCLKIACSNLGFHLAEIWTFGGSLKDGKSEDPVILHAFVEPVTIETYGKRAMFGNLDLANHKHVVSPVLVTRTRETKDRLWFTNSDPETPIHEDLPLNTAVAIPVTLNETHKDMVVIYFSMSDIQRQELALQMLQTISNAACIACLDLFLAHDWNAEETMVKFSHGTSNTNVWQGVFSAGSESSSLSRSAKERNTSGIQEVGVASLEYTCQKEIDIPNMNISWESLDDAEYLVNGSRCTIYTALYKEIPVVVKLVRKDVPDKNMIDQELEMETDILTQLRHPNIIRLIGCGSQPERFMVIERLDGGTLAQRCGSTLNIRDRRHRFKTKKPFNYLQLVTCAKQLAEALNYMHRDAVFNCIVIHRDLKPDNIGFDERGNLKLIDFGLAKIIPLKDGDATYDEVYELTGETGSLRYMAPEVAMRKPYNQKADVYGFGIILWEMASMKKPFEGLGRASFFELVVHGELKPPIDKHWPPEFASLLMNCWKKNPKERPSFVSIIDSLQGMIGEAQKLDSDEINVFDQRHKNIFAWLRRRHLSNLPTLQHT